MKGYLKCAVRNRFTFCGFLLFSFFLVTALYSGSPQIAFTLAFLGAFFLGITDFGLETYDVYKRTLHHIQKYGRVD